MCRHLVMRRLEIELATVCEQPETSKSTQKTISSPPAGQQDQKAQCHFQTNIKNPPYATRGRRRRFPPHDLKKEPASGSVSEPPETRKSPAKQPVKIARMLEPSHAPVPVSELPEKTTSPPGRPQVKRTRRPPSPWTPSPVKSKLRAKSATTLSPTCMSGVPTRPTLRSGVAPPFTLRSHVAPPSTLKSSVFTPPKEKKKKKKKKKTKVRCCPVPLNDPLSVPRSLRATMGRKRCLHCKQEEKRFKTIWQCEACKVVLCLIPGRNCFRSWHKAHNWG